MNGVVFAGIAPHGIALIPELSPDADGALATRAALAELARRCAAARPELLVIVSPHATRVEGAVCLTATARAAGTLRWHEREVALNIPCALDVVDQLAAAARADGVPVALAGFGGNQRWQSVAPLDWGVFVPYWFLGPGRDMPGQGDLFATPPAEDAGLPVAIVAPSRELPLAQLGAFGRSLARAAADSGRRVAVIASCDWAHTHTVAGPYGKHPAAREADALVVAALEAGDPGRLRDMPLELASDAKVDGLWQALMLAGVLEATDLRGELLSYEAPDYFGMAVASFSAPS